MRLRGLDLAVVVLSAFTWAAPVHADAASAATPAKAKIAAAPKPKAKAKPKSAKKKPGAQVRPAQPSPVSAVTPLPAASESAPPAPEPEPLVAPAIAPPHRAASTVEVPSTTHVHVSVPAGLQAWLDADDRMLPWLGKAIAAVDACYANVRASNAAAAGTVTFRLTMHENARPSAQPGSLPAALQSLVLCVTTRLMSVKMPLFTGKEGATYTVSVEFTP